MLNALMCAVFEDAWVDMLNGTYDIFDYVHCLHFICYTLPHLLVSD